MKISSVIHVVCFSDNMLMIFSWFLKVQKYSLLLDYSAGKLKEREKKSSGSPLEDF